MAEPEKKPLLLETPLDRFFDKLLWPLLLAGAVYGVIRAVDWYSNRRPARDGCLFVTQRVAGQLCVHTRDLGNAISPEDLDKIVREHPPLYCGEPLKAAEFAHLAGSRICAQTDVRAGAKFDPP